MISDTFITQTFSAKWVKFWDVESTKLPTNCQLLWRQRQLIVRPIAQGSLVPLLPQPLRLVECLRRSPVKAVRVDMGVGEETLTAWANVCSMTDKPVYLRTPGLASLPQKRHRVSWGIKRSLDWLMAVLLLIILSPLLLAIMAMIQMSSPGPIFFRQWRVGARGQLFRVWKFRTMVVDAEHFHHIVMKDQTGLHKLKDDPRVTPLGQWLRRLSLDELPQLFNVVCGEMSLVGPRPWAVYDAVRISPELRHRLQALPGITGAWQVEMRSHELELNTVNQRDLLYLQQWSLWQDFKFLLLTIPKVLSGMGAY